METPGALVVARVPGVIVPSVNVPVCVVSRCMYTSVFKCVLQRMHSAGERRCVRGATSVSAPPCMSETPSVEETPCASETPCVSGVFASVPGCVLPSTACVKGAPQVEEAACARETARVCEAPCVSGTPGVSERVCVSETPQVSAPARVSSMACGSEARCVSERPNVRKTACVRSLCVREMSVGMREHAAASPGVNVNLMECSLGVLTRGSVGVERRRRLRRLRDKGRVAAVVSLGTVPGLHSSERAVRAVQRTRPPCARL